MPAVVALGSTQLDVAPGAAVTVSVRIQNSGGIVDEFVVDVVGPTREWATIDPPSVSLFPNAEGTIQVIFRPPRSPLTRPGPTPFGIRVRSRSDASFSTVAEGRLMVGTFSEFEATISPRTSRSSRAGRHRVRITNGGNVPLQATVSASDPDELLTFGLESRRLDLPPSGSLTVSLSASAKSRKLRGPKETLPFEVRVESETAPPAVLGAAFQHQPLIGTTTMVVVGVAALSLVAVAGAAAGILPPIGPIGARPESPAPTIALPTPTPAPEATDAPTEAPTEEPSDGATEAPTSGATEAPTPPPTPTSEPTPTPTPAPERIVYVVTQNGNNEIWSANPDGSDAKQLTVNPASDDQPALSPDRRSIAFVSDRGGNSADIWIMPSDGGEATVLGPTGQDEVDPAWSSNGSRIVFSRIGNEGGQLCTIAANGRERNATCFRDARGRAILGDEPWWGADGFIYFSATNNDPTALGFQSSDIYRVRIQNNRGTPQLLVSTEASERTPVLSPNKAQLVYVAINGPPQVWATDPTGQLEPRQLTTNSTGSDQPAYSPDSTRIAVHSAREDGVERIWIISADGEWVSIAKLAIPQADNPESHPRQPSWN